MFKWGPNSSNKQGLRYYVGVEWGHDNFLDYNGVNIPWVGHLKLVHFPVSVLNKFFYTSMMDQNVGFCISFFHFLYSFSRTSLKSAALYPYDLWFWAGWEKDVGDVLTPSTQVFNHQFEYCVYLFHFFECINQCIYFQCKYWGTNFNTKNW